MLDIIEIVHINQRLAYVYITIIATQENQLLAFDSFRVITSFEKLPNFRCRRWHFHSPISRNSIQAHFYIYFLHGSAYVLALFWILIPTFLG
jgi:hypothetical protein